MIDSGCLLLAAERSRSGRAFLFISFLLFSSLSSPQPTKGALGLHRFCMFLLFISFVAKRNETKKGCRGLTCRLRRGMFFFCKDLLAHRAGALYERLWLLRPLRTEPTTEMVCQSHCVYGERWFGGLMFVCRRSVC